jgi:hypothetical protein
MALVRPEGAELRGRPDLAQTRSASLPPGTRLTVRRLVWNNLILWAEVENGAQSGYVPVTDLELP